jgi:anti-sigma factor RsiW
MTQTIDHLNPDKLSAFIDGELPPGDSQAIQQHLGDCHTCTLRVLTATRMKAATARAGRRFAPPADSIARLTGKLQPGQPKKTARIYLFPPVAWALLAALVLVFSIVGWQQNRKAKDLSAELLDQHLAMLSSTASPQVISTDRHTVKPWFQGKLPFSFNLPDALPGDTTLKGGDLTYLNGQPVALLVFTIGKHQVSVFLMQRAGGSIPSVLPRTRSGFSIRCAMTKELRIVAVSNVNPADLDLLMSALMQAQSP